MRKNINLCLLAGILFLSGCAGADYAEVAYVNDLGTYKLASGDQVRLIVFDQPSMTNVYAVDASGNVSIPLAGSMKAQGKSARELEAEINRRLQDQELVRDPKVAVEVAVYRPFSILGEVRTPGRFPYSPGMTVEAAVALASGYTIHADKSRVRITRRVEKEARTEYVSPTSTFMPGDTLVVEERWY